MVRGDAGSPPFRPESFALVACLGNVLGHLANLRWPELNPLGDLVSPGGRMVFEIVPGFGERSAYLSRLPPGAVARVLRSSPPLVRRRVVEEGFVRARPRAASDHGFRRLAPDLPRWERAGWKAEEVIAVAPALGFEPERLEAIRPDPKAWAHLLRLEEEIGRMPERQENAAALLVALQRG